MHGCIKDDSEELLKHALKNAAFLSGAFLMELSPYISLFPHPPSLCLFILFYFLKNINTTNTQLHTLTALMSLSTQSCATLCTCVRCCRRCVHGSLTWHKGHWTPYTGKEWSSVLNWWVDLNAVLHLFYHFIFTH